MHKRIKPANVRNAAALLRLYPNCRQLWLIHQCIQASRKVYNYFLDRKEAEYKLGKSMSQSDMQTELTALKKLEEWNWLNQVPNMVLQNAILELCEAYKRFFKKQNKHPKRKRFGSVNSFSYTFVANGAGGSVRCKDGKLILLKFNEGIKFHAGFVPDNIRKVTVRRVGERFYASIVYEKTVTKSETIGKHVGIDLGLKTRIVCSDGHEFQNPSDKKNKKRDRYIRRMQRRKAKAFRKNGKKTSNRQKILQKKIQRLHEKIRFSETDFLNKVTTKLAKENDYVSMETLNVKGMMKNRRLSRAVGAARFATVKSMLEYKLDWQGKRLILVDRFFPSSQLCSNCGYRNPIAKNLNVREWTCPVCERHIKRDPEASINIDVEGTRIYNGTDESVRAATAVGAGSQGRGGIHKPGSHGALLRGGTDAVSEAPIVSYADMDFTVRFDRAA
jgi:putative transposase